MGQHADRITNVEETTKKMEKQVDKIANLEEATKKIEEKADRITNLEETTKKIKKQTDKITNLRKATKKMKRQDDRITKLEETTNKIEKQAEKIASLEEVTNNIEKQADRITKLEEATNDMEKQADRITKLEEATNDMEKQADRITKLEEATNNVEKHADRITKLEEAANNIEKQADRITKLEEATNNIEKQADRITKLEEAANDLEKQADRITELEETVDKIENKANGITSIEDLVQKLNDQVGKLENNTLKGTDHDHDMKAAKVIESSINEIKDNVMKQSLAVRKMISEEKMVLRGIKNSLNEKFSNFTHEVKYQMSKLNASVESEVSSFKTILKVTEKNVSVTLNRHVNALNEANVEIQQLKTRTDNIETRQETLRENTDKELDNQKIILTKANGDIQGLHTRIAKVQENLGKRPAFTVWYASRQSNGILKFSKVYLNEGSVYDSTTGKFTSPYAGIYGFTASIIERGLGDNYIECDIRKNGYGYVVMISRQGQIHGTRATDGAGTATTAATLHLVKGDSVYVWCSSLTGTDLYWSSFSGFLINPDP